MKNVANPGKFAPFIFIALAVFNLFLVGAQDNYIPSVSLDNYWIVSGSPQLDASLAGTREFERGDTVTLYLDITNYGRIMGFDADKKADTKMEKALADRELDYEWERTTALGITGTLQSNTNLIEVKSGDQVIEALRSGEKSKDPMEFSIKIASHAPAGEYPLLLHLSYDYQYNAEVDANELDPEIGLRGFQTAYWYETADETITIPVTVKLEADFKITDVKAELSAGEKDGIIEVNYMNIGEEAADDAIARLSIFKPFSSTDDQAFIGTLQPGQEKTVVFRLDVDSDATPKEYSINSEIKYTDAKGDTVISESMKIPVTVNAATSSLLLPVVVLLIIAAAAGGYLYKKKRKA